MRISGTHVLRYGSSLLVVVLFFALPGCNEVYEKAREGIRFLEKKLAPTQEEEKEVGQRGGMSDRQRILRKFGEPAERHGIGSAARTEHGFRYNRKWNYYYRVGGDTGFTMRTVYFLDDTLAGSVIRKPDGTIVKEKLTFAF